jgi:hypothetical protein
VHQRHDRGNSAFAVEWLARPRAPEVTPLGEVERRAAQPLHWPVFVDVPRAGASTRAAQRAADAFGGALQDRLEPDAECLIEQPLGLTLSEHSEQRIDTSLDRTLAQQIGAETVNGTDARFLEVLHRLVQPRRRLCR